MKKQFLISAISAKLRNISHDPETAAYLKQGEDEFKEAGTFDLVNPAALTIPRQKRSVITAGPTTGADVDLSVTALEDQLIAVKAGARFLTNLKANLKYPLPSRITVSALAENAQNSDGGTNPGTITFAPRLRLTTELIVSKQLILQATPGTEEWLMNLIYEATGAKLESYIFGKAAATASTIQGMGFAVSYGTDSQKAVVVPTRAGLIALETELSDNNALRGTLAFITSDKGQLILKQLEREPGTGYPSLMEDFKASGYPVYFSKSVTNAAGTGLNGALLLFGDWSRLAICQFGNFSILPNPYSRAMGAQISLVINSYFDVRGLSGTETTGSGTDDNDYAQSFAALPIKLS
jgi:hypothetical protein